MSVDMSGFVAKLRAERLEFQDLPNESVVQATEEYIGKLLLIPEAQGAISSGVSFADSAAGMLAGSFSPPGLGAIDTMAATKVMDLILHAAISYMEHKYQTAKSEGEAGS
jgi:hypothetical protein